MKSKTFKKLTAMLLAVMLVLGMCATGFTVSAAESTYLVAGSSNLCTSNWDPSAATSPDNVMTLQDDGTYVKVYENVPVGDGYEFKVVKDGSTWYGENGGATNIVFNVTAACDVTITFDPTTNVPSVTGDGVKIPTGLDITGMYAVGTGKGNFLNGSSWDPAAASNLMTEVSSSVYEITYNDVAAGSYEVKFAANGAWTNSWGGTFSASGVATTADYNGSNIKFTTTTTTNVTLRIDLSGFKYSTKNGAKFTVTIVDPAADTNPSETTEPTETTTATTPVDAEYVLFGYIDGADYGDGTDYATIGEYKFVDGTLTTSFNETSYVGVKTTDNANWYMTDGWAGSVTEVVLYNTADLTTTADKLMVPGGVEITFTLVDNGDGTLTLSYTTGEEIETTTVDPDETTEPTEETDPTEKPTVTTPADAEYVLFGYINGADYGDGDDYATIGDYKFVDGTLKATFDVDSYVGVKTTDNANWYMTDGWAGSVTEVTLYSTAVLDETANKLLVPGGVEVTFTLVENADGTLTLSYVAAEAPTTEPTTEPATEPTTTLPAEGVSVYGDINLALADDDEDGTYEGYVDLQAGTYTFRISENGTAMCFGGKAFTDTLVNITYSSAFKAATTLNVTGGRYSFKYVTGTDKLTVLYKPFSEIVEIFGDITVTLYKSKGTLFTGSARLDAGTYEFRVNEMGVTHCFGYTFDDAVIGIEYNSSWTKATTFNATGGLYSFKYDTDTNKLTVQHAIAGVGDVRIFGDINIDLVKEQGGTLYSATELLEAGTYEFRVDELGTTMCFGSSFTDSIYKKQYMSTWKAATSFTTTGGKYTFRYDTATDELTVYYSPASNTVSIYGDIELELTSTTGTVYTGTTTLEAGTYAFRIDEKGTPMCLGGTFTDSIGNKVYSSDFKAATTFNATGGDYKFTYNIDTNKLIVAKVA